ncbi:MAG: hypothetical protein ABJK59_05910 [Erythrobacter sp.]|uniref:hypothetical protein n=1 Tax=Erythrobacter sp. TaxID=1042 RepID=UPI003297E00B
MDDEESKGGRAEEPGSSSWISLDNKVFDSVSIIAILSGVVVFCVGLLIDLSIPKSPEVAEVLNGCKDASTEVCREALAALGQEAYAGAGFDFYDFLASVLQALGLTTIAAVVISSTVDWRTRSYFFRQLSQKTERLGNNVLMGMFESSHHPSLFPLVREHIFDKNVIRRNIDINYTITDLDEDLSSGRLAGHEFVSVDVILSTVTENISASESPKNGRVTVPVGIGLPNPMLDELKRHVRINGFRIGEDQVKADEIEAINVKLQKILEDDDAVDAELQIGTYELEAGQQITVSGSYTMVKEAQDTEVFRSLEIAENIHFTVVDKSSHDLRVRARALAHGRLHGQESPSARQWKLDELSLPLQGIMVWWKKAPPGPSPLARGAAYDPTKKLSVGSPCEPE